MVVKACEATANGEVRYSNPDAVLQPNITIMKKTGSTYRSTVGVPQA